jgi:RNA polymerase sigma factor (sigma-70 family)
VAEINDILSKMNNGDTNAFKMIYDQYASYIYTICVRYNVNVSSIKDIMQNIFSACFMNIKKYDASKGEFKYWLRRIAVNQILTERKKWFNFTEEIDQLHLLADTSLQIYETIDMEKILLILKDMPVQYATVFNMFIIDGYSSKEIANLLEINENTVRSNIKRGRDWAQNRLTLVFNLEIKV